MGSGPDPLPMSERGVWKPALTEYRAWAVAKCAGEISMRRIMVDMIAEYARHNGHADLLRERIDGSTGV